jgi:hypothetical protein
MLFSNFSFEPVNCEEIVVQAHRLPNHNEEGKRSPCPTTAI